MNLTSVIDTIATQLAKQRRRSLLLPTSKCAYRGDGGSMCAVGCLIPDSLHTPELEKLGSVYNIFNRQPVNTFTKEWSPVVRDHLCSLLPELEHDAVHYLLDAFQIWHDTTTFYGDLHCGVTMNYQDVLNANPDATEDELKAIIVAHLTAVAAWRLPEYSNNSGDA